MFKMTNRLCMILSALAFTVFALAEPAHASTTGYNDDLANEITCLAKHIYHEARGEVLEGRVAVAAVVINRVADDRFPDTICGVVKQGGERRYRCQMTWYCDGRSDTPGDALSWDEARTLAVALVFGFGEDPTNGALWYHANYVRPSWADRLHHTRTIGSHIYYRDLES